MPEARLRTLGSYALALLVQPLAARETLPAEVQTDVVSLVLRSGPIAKFVLLVLLLFSAVSWGVILFKIWQFRRARPHSGHFVEIFRRSSKFSEVQAVCKSLASSPLVGCWMLQVVSFTRSTSRTPCEIHSGTYTTAGAMASDQTDDISNAGGSLSACDNYDCWYASFVALGLGPNLSDNGYGTAGSPAYIRGAFMNASSDTWDTNSNRRPDSDESVPSYPVVLSGDRDGDLTFDQTTCSSGSCSGDTYFMAFIGCGTRGSSGSYGNIVCGGSFVSGEKGIFIDTDANGSFDTEITNLSGSYYGAKNTDYLTLQGRQRSPG